MTKIMNTKTDRRQKNKYTKHVTKKKEYQNRYLRMKYISHFYDSCKTYV